MTQDNEGYIWQNNDDGLIRVDPLTETVDYFELPLDKYRPWFALPTTLPNGDIIFAGVNSYVRFNPADLESTKPTGKSIITSLQAGSETYELTYSSQEPEIQSDQNSLTFKFIGLDFKDPASINYRYRILGSENEQWNSVGTQRSVFIPNLESGDYTFEVQSGSQSGSFNETTASLNFSILPPWWNTIPAYFIYFILFGGLIYGADRVQRRRLIQKERERAREKELEQAKEIEKAYEDLKAAQEQLVQQEKLASLGQLTAGIAHEIKNPLNFVNNFSDLSMELVEEIRHEIRDMSLEKKESPFEGGGERSELGDVPDSEAETDPQTANTPLNPLSRGEVSLSPDTNLILEILDDIETNLKTIHKHGSRADSIVKSMLQHSRGGDGKMEPTPLNPLIKEYVNLAFHGMRAGNDPINVDIDMQLDETVGEVPLVAEDFSRVILNLANNAFDAMREKQGTGRKVQEIWGYEPKLSVRTHQKDQSVNLEIEDNGSGIPEEMKDKILQPFFTTKKGTQGTGLGLSITNDIVKAHGGNIEINSEQGRTVISIELAQKPSLR